MDIEIMDCLENGAGTCRNADYIETLEAERDAARAEVARLREALAEVLQDMDADRLSYLTEISEERCREIFALSGLDEE